jgi:DNA-binding PadR family transcriptional regulator
MAFTGKIKTSEATLSPVQLLLLALLNLGPAHGYSILQRLRQSIGGWPLQSGTVYPALRRLAEQDLIQGEKVAQEERPDAVEYQLTEKGKLALKEAFEGLGSELHRQDSVWRFLGAAVNGEAATGLFRASMRRQSPMGFVVMKRHCEGTCHGPVRLEFLQRYKTYLEQELDWVEKRLASLKDSDEP